LASVPVRLAGQSPVTGDVTALAAGEHLRCECSTRAPGSARPAEGVRAWLPMTRLKPSESAGRSATFAPSWRRRASRPTRQSGRLTRRSAHPARQGPVRPGERAQHLQREGRRWPRAVHRPGEAQAGRARPDAGEQPPSDQSHVPAVLGEIPGPSVRHDRAPHQAGTAGAARARPRGSARGILHRAIRHGGQDARRAWLGLRADPGTGERAGITTGPRAPGSTATGWRCGSPPSSAPA